VSSSVIAELGDPEECGTFARASAHEIMTGKKAKTLEIARYIGFASESTLVDYVNESLPKAPRKIKRET